MKEYYTTQEAAEKLNLTNDSYIRKLIRRKKLKAIKIGRDWAIPAKSIRDFQLEKTFTEVDREARAQKLIRPPVDLSLLS